MFTVNQHCKTALQCLRNSLKSSLAFVAQFKPQGPKLMNQRNYSVSGIQEQSIVPPKQNKIIIYKGDSHKSRFFLKINILGVVNYGVWDLFYMSCSQYLRELSKTQDTIKIALLNKEVSLKCVHNSIFALTVIGILPVFAVWLYTMRCIKSISLLKETKQVIFETYTPFGRFRTFQVPVLEVSGVKSRTSCKEYVPLKIKNNLFYFLIDLDGKFVNPALFDNVISIKRYFKK